MKQGHDPSAISGRAASCGCKSIAGLRRRSTRRSEIDSRGAAALWFRVEIRLKSNNPEQKHAKVKKRWK